MPASVCSRRRSSGTISSTVSSTSAEYAAPAADCWGWPGAPGASWLAWLPWPARPPRSRTWPLTSTTASSATTPPNCCSWLANRVTGRLPSRSSSTNRPMKRPAFGPLLIFTRVNQLTTPPTVTVPSRPSLQTGGGVGGEPRQRILVLRQRITGEIEAERLLFVAQALALAPRRQLRIGPGLALVGARRLPPASRG